MPGTDLYGTVTEFDEHVGLGTVTTNDGTTYLFHCVEIADGSRTIPIGAAVTFELLPKLGAYEASQLRPA